MTHLITRRFALAGLSAALLGPSLMARRASAAGTMSLVGVIEEDPPLINSAISSIISSFVASAPVYSALTHMDVNGVVSGDLAQAWEISPDGLTYTFHLHPNIFWHDGKPFSASDVVWSLTNVNSQLHPYRGAMKAFDKLEAPDANTVIMHLKFPQGSLINTLHNYAGQILPQHLWEGQDILKNPLNKAPIGTGPFKFVEYAVGDHISYIKNDKYFLPGKPAFDELTFRIIPDPSARIAAFQNKELDMMYSSAVPGTQVDRLSKLPGVTLKPAAVAAGAYLGYFNMRNAPYSDVRVRQAIAHAINKSFVRDNVLPGLSQNMVGPLPPSSPLYNASLKDYDYDPALANKMLDDAGFKRGSDGTRFPFRYVFAVNDLPASKMGDIIAQNLTDVGIKTILMPLERGTWMQRAFMEYQFDMTVGSFGLGPDPDVGVERFYNSNNIVAQPFVNNSPYSNPDVDKLFDQQRVESVLAKRKAIYDKIQEIIWAAIPIFPICAYSIPGVVRGSYATGIYDEEASNREDFVNAKPV